MRLALLAALLPACVSPPSSGSTSDESTGDATTDLQGSESDVSTTAAESSSDEAGSATSPPETTGAPESSSSSSGEASTGGPDLCGNGKVDPGEDCDDGKATLNCDDDCTPRVCGDARRNEAAGEECDDGNVDNTDSCLEGCVAASCGDGNVQIGVEECDDGNLDGADGCTAACTVATCGDDIVQAGEECDEVSDECSDCVWVTWSKSGVVTDLPVADLHHWELCWSDTYAQSGALVPSLEAACDGSQLLFGCRKVGAETLDVAANATRADMFIEVNYLVGGRHEANGAAWYWAPKQQFVGFAPSGNTAACSTPGEDQQMCWRTNGGSPQSVWTGGGRCGSKLGFKIDEEALWERVVFQVID